jgi:DNA helicase IV
MAENDSKHPEFEQENETLENVVALLKQKAFPDNSADYSNRRDLEARSRQLYNHNRQILDALDDAPYFGRFDFIEHDTDGREIYYIT